MRKFSSYGPVDTDLHYHAPRTELIENVYRQLTGEPGKGGHYLTVWAPRQTGKTWIMQQVMRKIRMRGDFEAGIITMQSARHETTDEGVLDVLVGNLSRWFGTDFESITAWKHLHRLFSRAYFERPLILIIDEFDAIREDFINKFANEFRDMYISRQNEADRPSASKNCLLHGLALIGIRSVLGIENVSGSPFNIQRSLRIPNLTAKESGGMFQWYERESGQKVDPDVVRCLFNETRGQPGLTCWLGELLTDGFDDWQPKKDRPLTPEDFEYVFQMAVQALPNNNILNIISKAKQEPYKKIVLNLFKTVEKTEFSFDDTLLNFLFMNGVISTEKAPDKLHVRFPSPFVQKRLFNYFARELFGYTGKLYDPFEDLSDTLTETSLNIRNLMWRFETYLRENREWLLADAPRRKDMRIFEAVYHFALYRYLCDFLGSKYAKVWPEFPTGNGKVDIMIAYGGKRYALELKSYAGQREYDDALAQAARYGKQLGLSEISMVFFVEYADDANREKYEKDYADRESGVSVMPVFVETGE
ncbi:MAG: hypothetical protein DRI57_19620 [Deltaproteobacteria bacterium]|nr:MAG: hypothetical protein DRI57_19620 [Deltaproteobacteria bacterium]